MVKWLPVSNCDGYEVSDDGRVRSLDRTQTLIGNGGREYKRCRKGKVLSLKKHPQGYRCVQMGSVQKTVHSVVMEAFVGPRPHAHCINHIDGDKTNNRVENLEYCTMSANSKHAYDTGLSDGPPLKRGRDHWKCRLTEIEVRRVRAYHKLNWPSKTIADFFGVGDTTIYNIIKRNSWNWLED